MSLLWSGPPAENSMVCEVRPPEPTVDEPTAKLIRLHVCLCGLMADIDSALDNFLEVSNLLPDDRDVLRKLDDLHQFNNWVTELAIREGAK